MWTRRLSLFVAACAAWCTAEQSIPNDYVMFIGNPGVGKSTLLNSLFQCHTFDSGPSFGAGLTQNFSVQQLQIDGRFVNIVDSPGLADVSTRHHCAEEIEKGLKQGGSYRIIIMVRQQDGRVVDEDKTTLKLILDALPKLSHNQFGILVNQVPRTMMKEFGNQTKKAKFVNSLLGGLVRETKFIRMVERSDDHESKPNSWFATDTQAFQQTMLLLKEIEPVLIETDDVEKVQADAFDKEREEYRVMLKNLAEDAERFKIEADKNRHIIDNLQTDLANVQKEFEDKVSEIEAEAQLRTNELILQNQYAQQESEKKFAELEKAQQDAQQQSEEQMGELKRQHDVEKNELRLHNQHTEQELEKRLNDLQATQQDQLKQAEQRHSETQAALQQQLKHAEQRHSETQAAHQRQLAAAQNQKSQGKGVLGSILGAIFPPLGLLF